MEGTLPPLNHNHRHLSPVRDLIGNAAKQQIPKEWLIR